jgi:hypothetical protein
MRHMSRNSTATGFELNGRTKGRSLSPNKGKIFLPRIQWVPGTLSPRVKRPGREADYLPPTSAEVMNTWIHTSTPPKRLHDVVLN